MRVYVNNMTGVGVDGVNSRYGGTIGRCGAGGYRVSVYWVEAIVSGKMGPGSSYGCPLCRGYRVGGCDVGDCSEVRVYMKNMTGVDVGGVNGRYGGTR